MALQAKSTVLTKVGMAPIPVSGLNRFLAFLDRNIRFLFPLPAFLVALGLFIYPLFELFRLSMCRWELTTTDPRTFVWFANFVHAFFNDSHFWKSIWLMLYFAFGSVFIQLVIGFALALLLNREFKGESVVRMLLLFPIIATPVAMSLTWSIMMNPFMGVLNYLLSLVGLGPSEWAANPNTVMPSLILVEVWHWTPFMMLVLLAGLKSLPKDPYEAAIIDGASKIQVFFKITLPLMQPYIVLVIILRLIHGFKVFDKIFVISGGGPNRASETLNLMIYHEAFAALNYGYASALGVVMLVIILLISLAIFRYRERDWSY
ncbi:MAG: sugar ABC transporter permease [Deltaproteobacteria bacterium]|nr:sugar ABC transporter permease [Deltaproteobacteria bacterium]